MDDTLSPLVLIPARNEQATIGKIVAIVKDQIGLTVVVIDDASTDNTALEASNAGAIVLPLKIHLGNWAAIQTGMIFSLKKGYKTVITMDADGQHVTEAIPLLLATYKDTQASVVIGSCPDRASELKGFAWSFFRKLTGLKVIDLTSGFRVYNHKSIQLLVSDELLFLEYQDIGVLLLIQLEGLQIIEADVMMKDRMFGKSRVYYSWLAIINYLLQTVILCVSKKTKSITSSNKCYTDD